MGTSLLATRLQVPTRLHRAVERARLLDALEHGIPRHRLTMIAAPAGYGKTTLLSQWARSTRHPVVWLSLREEDDDPYRFLRYLVKGWENVYPDVGESTLGLLLDAVSPDIESVLSAFINLGSEISGQVAFAIDDYHVVNDQAIHETLAFLLDNLPPALHFVLSGRTDPPLPLARYRARGELLELRPEDLRFQPEESARFLSDVLGLSLPDDQVAALHEQLEGWPAGLQLAGLSIQRHTGSADPLPISGRHRYVADYLAEDVLAELPADVQNFMLRTSILPQLTASLCDQVTGGTGSQAMLERLERENLFIVPLDDRREWYRYHRVFGDFLRETVGQRFPDEIPELHRRAARWYLDHNEPDFAFDHAIAAGDAEISVEVCDRYTNAKLLAGELRTVGNWLERLPLDWFRLYPVLVLVRAGYLVYSGDLAGCLHCIDEVESTLSARSDEDARWQMARVTTLRCFIACEMNDLKAAEQLAARALSELEEGNLGFLPGIYNALGDTYRRNGLWEEAEAAYLKVLEFPQSPAVRIQSAHIYGALADLSLQRGQLRAAERYWQRALAAIQGGDSWGVLPLPVIGWIYIRLAEILYEWNRLDLADEYLTSGLDRVELGGDVRAMIAGFVLAGRLALARGDMESAAKYRDRAGELVEESAFHEWISQFERFRLELWIAQDRLRAAVSWADSMLEDETVLERPENEATRLAMARVLIVKGDAESIRRGLNLLDNLLHQAAEEGRADLQIEALAIQSLGHWARGTESESMLSLERALTLAEPEGYVRRFIDLGIPMVRALQEARSRGILPDYVRTLLSAVDIASFSVAEVATHIPEPLTEREREILDLLAAGLTNNEISQKLFISPETVKKHTRNIYGKLGVRSRTEAAARARALNLLG